MFQQKKCYARKRQTKYVGKPSFVAGREIRELLSVAMWPIINQSVRMCESSHRLFIYLSLPSSHPICQFPLPEWACGIFLNENMCSMEIASAPLSLRARDSSSSPVGELVGREQNGPLIHCFLLPLSVSNQYY